jgi:hypothetical protein
MAARSQPTVFRVKGRLAVYRQLVRLGAKPLEAHDQSFSFFESKSHYDRRSGVQSVLVSSPIWGPRPNFCYCQTFTILSMWGTLSDEKTGLSFVAVIISCTWHLIFTGLHAGILHSHLSSVCGYILFTVLYVTLVYIYVQYIQRLCESRLGTADRALTHVAHVTTAA